MRGSTRLIVAALWLPASVLLAEEKPRDPWAPFDLVTVRVPGITLRYQKRLASKIGAIRATVADFAKKEAEGCAQAKAIRAKSAKILEQVNAIVGFSPSEKDKAGQREMLLMFLNTMEKSRLVRPGRKCTLYLIATNSLKDYLRKGGKLPGCTYNRATDRCRYEFKWEASNYGTDAPRDAELVLPLDSDAPGEEIRNMLGVVRGGRSAMTGGGILHEVIEMTILTHKLDASDPRVRWFSDGFANAISLHVLRSHLGEKASARFAALWDVAEYADLTKESNLQYWPGMSFSVFPNFEAPLESEERLSHARYRFATREAVRLIDSHGIGCVAKILNRACAGKRRAGRQDLLAAVKETTGEDMAKRLLRYQSFKTRQEGLAIYAKRYDDAIARKDDPNALIALLREYELKDRVPPGFYARVAKVLLRMGHEPTEWCRKEAEGGSSGAMHGLGTLYLLGRGVKKDPVEALKWYRKAANAGNATSMMALGSLHREGQDVRKDLAEALKWYRKAADAGFAPAMRNLAAMYHGGMGVEKDLAEAERWLHKEAEAAGPAAMNRMGLWHADGNQVRKDPAEAARWFRRAAEAGFVPAMHNLADAYEKGLGVKKDPAEAARWTQKADEARKVDRAERKEAGE